MRVKLIRSAYPKMKFSIHQIGQRTLLDILEYARDGIRHDVGTHSGELTDDETAGANELDRLLIDLIAFAESDDGQAQIAGKQFTEPDTSVKG